MTVAVRLVGIAINPTSSGDPWVLLGCIMSAVESTVVEKRRSRSKPEMGLFRTKTTVFNQHDVPVMTYTALAMIATRDPGGSD